VDENQVFCEYILDALALPDRMTKIASEKNGPAYHEHMF
jgi:hypothetical protein